MATREQIDICKSMLSGTVLPYGREALHAVIADAEAMQNARAKVPRLVPPDGTTFYGHMQAVENERAIVSADDTWTYLPELPDNAARVSLTIQLRSTPEKRWIEEGHWDNEKQHQEARGCGQAIGENDNERTTITLPPERAANLARCKGGNHNLQVIARMPVGYGSENVVRWCCDCGSVAIDVDTDGRTDPGATKKMRRPTILGGDG